MDEARFRHRLRARSEGYFELLAAAAGDPAARARIGRGLRGDALAAGPSGDAVAPSLVRERVEALSVVDPEGLRQLAAGWPPAPPGHPFLEAAWQAGLRHLDRRSPLDDPTLPPGSAVAAEAARVWGPAVAPLPLRWSDLDPAGHSPGHTSDQYREFCWAPLVDEEITADDLADSGLGALRVLRGRAAVLDPTARAMITERCEDLPADPLEAALVVETTLELELLDDARLGELRTLAAAQVDELTDARGIIPLAYVLLRPTWRVP